VTVQGHYRHFDDYDSPEGEVFNSGSELYGARARWDQFAGSGLFSVAWQSDLGRDVERPRDNSRQVRFFYPTEDSHRVVASWEAAGPGGFNRLHASAFLGSYAIVTDQDSSATAAEPRAVERADVSARDFHLRLHAERPLGEARFEVGVDLNGRFGLRALDVNERYDPAGGLARVDTNVSVDEARRIDGGLYAMLAARPGNRLDLSGGLRVDHVTTRHEGGYFGDRSTAKGALSGFASAVVRAAKGLELTLQVARGYRDPALSDRYFRGPTGRGFITGNPELESETSLQLDTALRYSRPGWRMAAYAYQYRIDGLIERFEDEADFFFFRNRGRARLRGLELEGRVELGAGFNAELSGSLLRGDALDDGEPLADLPPATLSLRLGRQWKGGFAQLRTAFFGDDGRQGSGEVPRERYSVVDLAAGVELGSALLLRLSARNLLDEAFFTSTDRRATLAPGRSLLVSAQLSF
jgi:outer membrane receptor protein involved in Fe transport